MTTERWELRHPDGTPGDQRVIGIVGDEATVVAGVPYGTDEEKRRAALMVEAPELLRFARTVLDCVWEVGDGTIPAWRVEFMDSGLRNLQQLVARAEGRS